MSLTLAEADDAGGAPTGNVLARAAWFVERGVGSAVEWITALLITIEIGILLAGVIARYVLHAPLVRTDEAASLRGKGFDFYDWGPGEARLVISWNQREEQIRPLADAIAAL